MVNNYKRKSDRQSWCEEDLKNAIEKVATRKIGLNKAAATFNVQGKGKSTKKSTKKKSIYSSSEDEEDVRYFYCNHLFSESTEGWVQCPACSLWAHCSCAGVEDDDEDVRFVCERCAVD